MTLSLFTIEIVASMQLLCISSETAYKYVYQYLKTPTKQIDTYRKHLFVCTPIFLFFFGFKYWDRCFHLTYKEKIAFKLICLMHIKL